MHCQNENPSAGEVNSEGLMTDKTQRDAQNLSAAYLGQESAVPVIMEKVRRAEERQGRRNGCCLTTRRGN